MSSAGIYVQEVVLQAAGIHGFGRPSGDDQNLFVGQPPLDTLANVMPAMTVRVWLIHGSLNEIKPGQQVFRPQLEAVQQLQVRPVRQGQLVFTVGNKPGNGLVIIIKIRIGDLLVNPVHLHFDFFIDGYFPTKNRISKFAVINRRGSVG